MAFVAVFSVRWLDLDEQGSVVFVDVVLISVPADEIPSFSPQNWAGKKTIEENCEEN